MELLLAYPSAGVVVAREDEVVLRRVVLPSTPYVAWYVYDARRGERDVWIVRLLHASQKRPAPDISRWVPTVRSHH